MIGDPTKKQRLILKFLENTGGATYLEAIKFFNQNSISRAIRKLQEQGFVRSVWCEGRRGRYKRFFKI